MGNEFHFGVHSRHGFVIQLFGIKKIPVAPVKFVQFVFFVRKNFCSSGPANGTFNGRVYFRRLPLNQKRRTHQTFTAGIHRKNQNWQGYKDNQGQLPANRKHNKKSTNQSQNGNQKVFRPMVRQFRNFKKVGSNSAHKLTGTVPVKKRKRLSFYVLKNIPAHVLFHGNAKNMPEISDEPVSHSPQNVHQKTKPDNRKKSADHSPGSSPISPRRTTSSVFRKNHIQNKPGNRRKNHIHGSNKNRAEQIGKKQTLVGLKIREKQFIFAFFYIPKTQGQDSPFLTLCHFQFFSTQFLIPFTTSTSI